MKPQLVVVFEHLPIHQEVGFSRLPLPSAAVFLADSIFPNVVLLCLLRFNCVFDLSLTRFIITHSTDQVDADVVEARPRTDGSRRSEAVSGIKRCNHM